MARVSAQERRRQLVGAAFQLVAREGVAAASTRRIAAEAGVPPAVVHYAFASKQELLTSMMSLVFEESERAVKAALRPSGEPQGVQEALRQAVEQLFEAFEADPARQQAVFDLISDALRTPETTTIVRDHQSRIDHLAETFLTTLAHRTRTTWALPIPHLARLLITALDGTLLAWLIDRDTPKAQATLASLTTHLAAHTAPAPGRIGG